MIRNIERDYRIIYTCTNPPVPIYVDMARKHLAEGVARRFIMIGDSLEAIDRSRRGSRCCHGTHDRVVRDWKLQTCIGAIWTRGIQTVDLRQQVSEDYGHVCDIAELVRRQLTGQR